MHFLTLTVCFTVGLSDIYFAGGLSPPSRGGATVLKVGDNF